jgi:hypothetical protein
VFLGFCAPRGDNGTYCRSAGDQTIMSSFSGHLFDLPSFLNPVFVCPGVISSLIHRFGTWLVLYHTVCL